MLIWNFKLFNIKIHVNFIGYFFCSINNCCEMLVLKLSGKTKFYINYFKYRKAFPAINKQIQLKFKAIKPQKSFMYVHTGWSKKKVYGVI